MLSISVYTILVLGCSLEHYGCIIEHKHFYELFKESLGEILNYGY